MPSSVLNSMSLRMATFPPTYGYGATVASMSMRHHAASLRRGRTLTHHRMGVCCASQQSCRMSDLVNAQDALHAPADMPTALSSVPRYADMTSPRARVALTVDSGGNMQSS